MKHTLLTGSSGIAVNVAGIIVSVSKVEAWLRITSLLIGCAVGLLTAGSIIRKWRKGE